MIWEVMSGNGVRIGMIVIRPGVFCGAVLGSAIPTACVQLSATSAMPRVPTSSAVFVVCQDQNNYHFPCIAWPYCFTTCW